MNWLYLEQQQAGAEILAHPDQEHDQQLSAILLEAASLSWAYNRVEMVFQQRVVLVFFPVRCILAQHDKL